MQGIMLRIPTEIRIQIVRELVGGHEVHYGSDAKEDTSYLRNINAVASLLTTSEQLRDEAQFCVHRTMFHFPDCESFLDFFMMTSKPLHAHVRLVTLTSIPMPLVFPNTGMVKPHFVDTVLTAISGLALDLLIVHDAFHVPRIQAIETQHPKTYFDMQNLLYSDGWKELHFISRNSKFLRWPNKLKPHPVDQHASPLPLDPWKDREAQPEHWNKMLEERDGSDSGSSVSIYREYSPGTGILNLATCERINKIDGDDGLETVAPAVRPKPVKKQPQGTHPRRKILVIARRGEGTTYTTAGKSCEHIQVAMKQYGWEGLRTLGMIGNKGLLDPCKYPNSDIQDI